MPGGHRCDRLLEHTAIPLRDPFARRVMPPAHLYRSLSECPCFHVCATAQKTAEAPEAIDAIRSCSSDPAPRRTAGGAQQRVVLPAKDAPLRSRPADVWTVGTDEGESWEMLSNVLSMAFDANDILFALDQGSHRILVFDRNGRFVRRFGEQGEGPGESQAPMALAILGDGTLVLTDLGRRGFVLFDDQGTYLRDVPLPEDFGMPRPNELFVRGNEIIARSMPLLRFSPGGAPPDLSSPRKSPVFRFGFGADAAPRTLHEFLMEPPQVRTSNSGGRQTVMATMSRATFEKEPSFAALADGGVAISASNDYTIEIKDASGRSARSLSQPIAAKRVTERDRNDARDEQRERLKNGTGSTTTVAFGGGGAVFRTGPGGGGAPRCGPGTSMQSWPIGVSPRHPGDAMMERDGQLGA